MRLRVIVLAGIFSLGAIPGQAQELPAPRVLSLARSFQLQGAGSCAAAACHNAAGFAGFQGREYAVALERDAGGEHVKDRHAEAYDTLFSARSLAIARKLHGPQGPRPEADALCLRCHVHPGFDRQPARLVDGVAQFRLEDGVSCEACHGPAERWLAPHFRADWNEQSVSARLALGFADTRSLPGRVQTCVDCHVGAPDMEVNHDLIAAGHPRLHFEFSAFHTLWHKHWDPTRDTEPHGRADFEARAWVLGQVVAARADLQLLAYRADPVNDRPWPEFAAQDCFACHHDLKAKSWRQQAGFGKRKAGVMPMNTWYTAELPAAVASLGLPADDAIHASLERLRQSMEVLRPDRQAVAAQARAGAALLDALVARLDAAPASPLRLRLGADAGAAMSWDAAAQRYLALAALGRAGTPLALPKLRDLLRFPPGFDSPANFDPAALRQALDAYNKASRQR